MSAPSSTIRRGLLNLPGANSASKSITERLLKTDKESHHCFFRSAALHNHLSHHVLAAYDLGAPASVIKAIYDEEAKIQRPIDLKLDGVTPEASPNPGEVKDGNWTKWLGDQKAYSGYLTFFSEKIAKLGVVKTLEDYIFSPAANGNDSEMLLRLFGGAMHPFIHVGYGLEFDSEILVAAGIAQAAVHSPVAFAYIPLDKSAEASIPNGSHPVGKGRQPKNGPSILSLLRQIYDSPELTPVLPYEPDALLSKRVKDLAEGGVRIPELHRILGQFEPGYTSEALDERVEEMIFVSTLLTFGTGKPHRKPRVDFFLMHLLTSSLFVPSFLKHMPNMEYKRTLLKTFLQPWGMIIMTRGRPRIDPKLLMSYTENPLPPNTPGPNPQPYSLGGEYTNPWLTIISDVTHAPEAHTPKALRTLLYGATRYGTLAKGDIIGAWESDNKETHLGINEVDGTVFIRAAGVLVETLGWVTHGQKAGNWDRSALGWDDAWKGED